jgi:uncharacterized protein (DUF1501 family)
MRESRRSFLLRVSAGADVEDLTTLVCIFLRGGADTLNVVVPYGDDRYYRARPTIAIPPPSYDGAPTSALRLDEQYALHPAMRPLERAFREGRLGIVQSVGSDDDSGSHFEAQDQMERGAGNGVAPGGGWIGRFLRARRAPHRGALSAVAIGAVEPESLRGAGGSSVIGSLEDLRLAARGDERDAALQVLAALYAGAGELGTPAANSLELLEKIEGLRNRATSEAAGMRYADDRFSRALGDVARLVKARVGLEVACVDLDGWDTHFLQGGAEGLQADAIRSLGIGLAAFDADLEGYRRSVVTIVMTEFGRRVYENSSAGTDHGRGFALLALGERVRGGCVIGEAPDLDVVEPATGPGGVAVKIDYRSVLAELVAALGGVAAPESLFPDFSPSPVGLFG